MAQGVPGRLRPPISFRHYKDGRSSAKRTGRIYPRRNPWYSLSEGVCIHERYIYIYTLGDPKFTELIKKILEVFVKV